MSIKFTIRDDKKATIEEFVPEFYLSAYDGELNLCYDDDAGDRRVLLYIDEDDGDLHTVVGNGCLIGAGFKLNLDGRIVGQLGQ